jgi:hypothetical protein
LFPALSIAFHTLVIDKLRLQVFPTISVSRNRTRSLAKFSESVTVFPFLLPKTSLQFPFPINRDNPMAFLNPSGICFVLIIADDFSASSFPINRDGRIVSCLDDPVSKFFRLLQAVLSSIPVFLAVDWITSFAQILQSFKEPVTVIWDDLCKLWSPAASSTGSFLIRFLPELSSVILTKE